MTSYHTDFQPVIADIIATVGKKIIIGVPLGLGKPIGLLNALYVAACQDQTIELTILTGLTLSRPFIKNALEKRLVEPILERVLKDYEDALYEKARILQRLPKNINVIEFFLVNGRYLNNCYVQQHYNNSSYTDVVRDVINRSMNVLAQQITHSIAYADKYSLSCNTDLFKEAVEQLAAKNKKAIIVGEVNQNLPFMYGEDAVIDKGTFTHIVDTKKYKALFAIPRDELSPQDYLIGLYTSCLIKDGSCLQIGIGKHSSAIASALILRHKDPAVYQDILKILEVENKFGEIVATVGSSDAFKTGLYASTEMFSDEYMQLYHADILKKSVYDHVGLQHLLNIHKITEKIDAKSIDVLLEHNIIHEVLTAKDIEFLVKFGFFKEGIRYHNNELHLVTGEKISNNLTLSKDIILKQCLGDKLKSGKIMHAGFFLGSLDFYSQLKQLSPNELQKIDMTTVSRTNTISWSYELSQLQRQDARLINYAMMVTLNGAVISDGLRNMQEVSGVGGQFDFVNMARELHGARAILNCRSTRKHKGRITSNIVWEYTNITLPRYLRDIVITEYGIADCRGKTDSEVIKAILNITDSRFQNALLKKAIKYGKLPKNYCIPEKFKQNFPDKCLAIAEQYQNYFKPYPFGSDLTEEEIVIEKGLLYLNNLSRIQLIFVILRSLLFFKSDVVFVKYLQRMDLVKVRTLKEYFYKKLLKFSIYHLGI